MNKNTFLIEANALEKNSQLIETFKAKTEKFTMQEISMFLQNTPIEQMQVKNKRALIKVEGVLFKNPNPLYRLIGIAHTSYVEIMSQLKEANSRDDVDVIFLAIDSPGGSSIYFKEVMNAIHNSTKPVLAYVGGICASAAYGLASQCNKIIANTEWATVGSIGAMSQYTSSKEHDKSEGIKTYTFRSKGAEKKSPEPDNAKGADEIQKLVDDYGVLFYEAIARGRKTTPEMIEKNYGGGAMFTARDAIKMGMIDEIQELKNSQFNMNTTKVVNTNMSSEQGEINMTEEELKKAQENLNANDSAPKPEPETQLKTPEQPQPTPTPTPDVSASDKNINGFILLNQKYPNYSAQILLGLQANKSELELELEILRAENVKLQATKEIQEHMKDPVDPVNPDVKALEENKNIVAKSHVATADKLLKSEV